MYGHRYFFFLQDAVEDVPEYLVHWDNFVQCVSVHLYRFALMYVRLAAEYRLHPLYRQEFHQVFEENQEHSEFGPLMVKMKVVDSNGESAMDEDQWEAASMLLSYSL